jgi:hypothetical protein
MRLARDAFEGLVRKAGRDISHMLGSRREAAG